MFGEQSIPGIYQELHCFIRGIYSYHMYDRWCWCILLAFSRKVKTSSPAPSNQDSTHDRATAGACCSALKQRKRCRGLGWQPNCVLQKYAFGGR